MKKIIPILLVLFLLFTASALAEVVEDYLPYAEALQKLYKSRETDEAVVKDWKEGVQAKVGLIFDHLTVEFDPVYGVETTAGEILIGGVVTSTGFCKTTDGNKIRLVQMVGMAILMSKGDMQVLRALRVTDFTQNTLTGWDDMTEI